MTTTFQPPRISSHPPYVRTSGGDAAELAAIGGLHLDAWQRHALDIGLGERADGKWSAFEVGLVVPRQNGKSEIAIVRSLAGLFLFGERLILHSAHEYKTAQEAFLRIKALIDNSDWLRRKVRSIRNANGEQGIELLNGNRLRFVARSKGSGRGFTGDLVILDEAYELGPVQMAALLPTLSSRPNPQIWYASSAGMATSEQLHSLRQRGIAGGDGLAYMEWSAPDDADSSSLASWQQANPALNIRIPPEFVARERDAMPAHEFGRERLGWFDAPEDSLLAGIPEQSWTACLSEPGDISAHPALAIDVALDRSHAAIAVAGTRADGRVQLELVDYRPGTAWVVGRVAEMATTWGADVTLDAAGPAGSLVAELLDAGVRLTMLPRADVVRACGGLFDAVTEGTVAHLGDVDLTYAVLGGRLRTGESYVFTRKGGVDICPLYAVTLARWTAVTAPVYDLLDSVH